MTWPDVVVFFFDGLFVTAILLAVITDFWDNVSRNLFSSRSGNKGRMSNHKG